MNRQPTDLRADLRGALLDVLSHHVAEVDDLALLTFAADRAADRLARQAVSTTDHITEGNNP